MRKPSSTVPLGRPSSAELSRNPPDPTIVVSMLGNDIKVRTVAPRSMPKGTGSPRASVPRNVLYGKACGRRLRDAVKGLLDPKSFITLTFPAWLKVGQEFARKCWDRVRRWLEGKGASGVMTLERTDAGTPHFHAVVDAAVSGRELERIWARLVGVDDSAVLRHGVRVSHVHAQKRLANYMAKPRSKVAPEGWSVARWWSSFGKQKPTKPKVVLSGARSVLTTFLWNLWRQRPGGKPPRTPSGDLPARFWVTGGVDANWALLKGLGLVE